MGISYRQFRTVRCILTINSRIFAEVEQKNKRVRENNPHANDNKRQAEINKRWMSLQPFRTQHNYKNNRKAEVGSPHIEDKE